MNGWLILGLVVVVVVLLGHHPRRRAPVPSHSAGYDALHRSQFWRKELNAAVRARAHGRCEHPFCWKRRGLTKHLWTYACLRENRRPRLDEVELLCPRHHHRADTKRRTWEARHRRVA